MKKAIILTEKPSASLKIAKALADKKIEKKEYKKVPYYEIEHNKQRILILCAVGHLYTLTEKEKSNDYPVLDCIWIESYKVKKSAAFSKKYLETIKKFNDPKAEVYLATDKDLEGEILGYNIIRYALKRKDAKRMEFSTMTANDLKKAFENPKFHLDFPLTYSGETRHFLDYLYGISNSRALTNSIKNASGRYKLMSTGRVQGPTLHILAHREKEILSFKPKTYWQIKLFGNVRDGKIESLHIKDKFWDKKEADSVIKKTKNKDAIITEITKIQFKQPAPNPFDLTSLQVEAYKTLKISPKETLSIAQNLYVNGLISYPRTSSQKLPEQIGYKKILQELSKQNTYAKLCEELLKGKLRPNNGKKTDPAHPAIYATGEIPKKLNERERNIYDLIVRRTLATFAEPALRETINIKINCNNEIFVAKGTKTVKEGWHKFYGKFALFKEEEFPKVKEKDKLSNVKINLLKKETQPPKRFTPASIIKELEKINLGTKATRSAIIETLYDRNYIKDQKIKATELGIKVIATLEKYCSEIIDEKLTRHFEKEMQEILEQKKKKDEVVKEAKEVLDKIAKHFKENEIKIGKELAKASLETTRKDTIVGQCPKCNKNLKIMYSKKNRQYFISCEDYKNCKTTFSLPNYALPKPTEEKCNECNWPLIKMIRKAKRPYDFCLNPNCPKKKRWLEQQQNQKA